eukprot:Opistho-1_new@37845
MKTFVVLALLAAAALVVAQDGVTCDCPNDFHPVCAPGANGTRTTYDNACVAKCRGAENWRNGTCEHFPVEPRCFCPLIPRPVCAIRFVPRGAKLETMTNDCVAKCEHAEILHDGPCPPFPKFPVVPCIASQEWRPVCAETADGDKKDFANAQAAWCANAKVVSRGRCNATEDELALLAAPEGALAEMPPSPRPEMPEGMNGEWPNQHDNALFPMGHGGFDDCSGGQGGFGPQQGGFFPPGAPGGFGPQQGGQGGFGPQQGGFFPPGAPGGFGPQQGGQGGFGPQQGGFFPPGAPGGF